MPRKGFEPTKEQRQQVDAMAAYGVPAESIARVLAISKPTLLKYFRDELDTGHIKANSAVAQSLFRKATGEGSQSVTAAIFWLKVRAGWSEYAPHPLPVPLGKKQQAELDAVTSAKGTEWSELVH
jgi:hypothetical protein